MAVQRFKVALNNAAFPLVSTKAQRAVFVPGLDAAPRTPRIFMGADDSADYNMSQVIYAENVMPVAQGVHSVGYSQFIAPTINDDFDSVFALRDADENTVLFSPAGGNNYIYDTTLSAWYDNTIADVFDPIVLDPALNPAESKVTYAYVDGKTFVCYSRLKSNDMVPTDMSIMFWDGTNLVPAGSLISNLPFPVGEIDGIASSSGYLLVYSDLTVAWAPFNGTAFDFTIYANGAFTGAGFQVPEDIQGKIRAIITLSGGFAIFTDRNAIAANYHAQNITAPWVFREIPDAGGLESYEQATVEGTLGSVYAYTTTGLQRISLNSAELVMPAVGDFIAGRQIERYRFETQELYQGLVNLDFYVKIANIGNRYLVVSYGTAPGVYSFALVYDFALQRWGKLRMVHRDCFYYAYGAIAADLTYAALGDVPYDDPSLTTYDATTGLSNAFVAAPHGLAFLKRTGEIVIANWSDQARSIEDEAVVVLGRVQLSRSSHTQLNRIEAEGLKSGRIFVQPSYDGRTLVAAQPTVDCGSTGDYALKGCMIDCKNFNIVIEGTFDLSTVILEATTSGKV
jgi:hypothetical protein